MGSFWDDAEVRDDNDKEFTPIPDGDYVAQIIKVVLDLANKYGPRLEVTLKLAESHGDFANRRRWINYLLDNKTSKGMLLGTLKKLNIDYSQVTCNEDLGFLADVLMGKHVDIYCKRNPKKDKPNEFYDNTYINGEAFLNSAGLRNHAEQAINTPGGGFDAKEPLPFD